MDVAAVRADSAHPGPVEGPAPLDPARAGWFKSSFSQGNGECVECAALGGGKVGMRDSKRPEGAVLTFGPGEWRTFVSAMREGAFRD